MTSGFNDPIDVKHPKEKKNPWSFKAPTYDERSSCFVRAGSNYGVGHAQPIGKKKASKEIVIPTGKVNTMQTQYFEKENIPYEE